jgi:hypothetical protein
MRNVNTVTKVLVAFAALGLCVPSAAVGATTPVAKPKVMDVALMEGNVLVGQLVNTSGGPVAGAKVVVQNQDKTGVDLKTDKDGVFAVKGVPAGVYRVASKDAQGVYRVWSPKTAPPGAQTGALLVSGNEVVRGQEQCQCPAGDQCAGNGVAGGRGAAGAGSRLRNMLANPWIVAGIVAAAVAIPVAIHNSHHSSPTSP